MSKHTPGPWRAEIGDENEPWSHQWPRIVSDEYEVVGTEGLYGDFETDCANARLIAAAPELLAALKECVCALETCGKDYRATELARAAIAKATGEPQ